MPRHPVIEALLELHRIDNSIHRLTTQKDLLPVSLQRIATRLEKQREALESRRGRVKELRADTAAKELDLRSAEEEIEKLTVQLNRARTNKEFATFQHEIAAKKADSSRIEDQVLAAMTDIEELETEARELDKSISQIVEEHKEEATGIEGDIAGLDERIAKLKKARVEASEKVDGPVLEEYERIAAKKGASALAPVVENACQGCFMQLPPQLGHELRGGRQVVRCPNCSRLLYLP